jgi:hypothetical protein
MARHTYNILIHPTELCIPTSAKGKEPFKFYEKEIITIKKKREKGVRQQQQEKSFSLDVGESKKKKSPKRNMSGLVETCFTTADTFFFFNSPRRRRRRTFFSSL